MALVTPEARILFGEDEIRRRVRDLGADIGREYAGRSPLLVTVLKGAVIFLADLIRATDLDVGLDFMSISSYGGSGRAAGVVRILKDLDEDITGRDVIVVEDIIDTGLTLSYLLGSLRARSPASLEVCALLDRSVRRIAPIDIRWVGFDLPDVFASADSLVAAAESEAEAVSGARDEAEKEELRTAMGGGGTGKGTASATRGANAIIRGLRATSDFDFEFQLALMNRHLNHDIEALFLMTSLEHAHLSKVRGWRQAQRLAPFEAEPSTAAAPADPRP